MAMKELIRLEILRKLSFTYSKFTKLGISNLHPLRCPKSWQSFRVLQCITRIECRQRHINPYWELMGLHVDTPFVVFTDTGFPKELMEELKTKTGHGWLGNYSASGTEIIKELGEEHISTKKMIVYTSADSVLQIACHEHFFGLEELYRCCEIAREITMKPQWRVGRIIARPFIGETAETFKRTANRHDYAIAPYDETVLDFLKQENYDVISVGKINDIFSGCGITEALKSKSNAEGMEVTIKQTEKDLQVFVLQIWSILMLYGVIEEMLKVMPKKLKYLINILEN